MDKKLPIEIKSTFLGYTKEALKTIPKVKCPICDSDTRCISRGIYECLFCGTLINLSRPAYDILHIKTGRKDRTYTPESFLEEEKIIVEEWKRKNEKKG